MEGASTAAHPHPFAPNVVRGYPAAAAPAATTDHRHHYPPSTFGAGARCHRGRHRRQQQRGRDAWEGRWLTVLGFRPGFLFGDVLIEGKILSTR
jgi:hypothetical protein